MKIRTNILLAALLLALCCQLAAQSVEVIDRRPLNAALDRMEAYFGGTINYEDVPYENEADLELVTDPRIRPVIAGKPARVPRKGSVSLVLDTLSTEGDRVRSLNELIGAYRRGNLPGDFRVEQANGMFYLVGSQTMGEDGKLRDVQSPTLSAVTIPFAKRTVIDTVALIASQMSKTVGVQVLVGQVPSAMTDVTFAVQGEPARDAIAKLFRTANPDQQVCYRLLFDTLVNGYMLNLQVVSAPDKGQAQTSTVATPSVPGTAKWFDPVRR